MLKAKLSHAVLPKRCSAISTAYDIQLTTASFTAHDRIIYDIYDDRVTVLVVQAEEHYNDK